MAATSTTARPASLRRVVSRIVGGPATVQQSHAICEPLALLNASAITEIRTAAVSVVATDVLARSQGRRIRRGRGRDRDEFGGAGARACLDFAGTHINAVGACLPAMRELQPTAR